MKVLKESAPDNVDKLHEIFHTFAVLLCKLLKNVVNSFRILHVAR